MGVEQRRTGIASLLGKIGMGERPSGRPPTDQRPLVPPPSNGKDKLGKVPTSPINGQTDKGQTGDASGQIVRPAKRKERREFFAHGGIIREADLSKDTESVNALYLQPSAIEHFAEVTPESSAKDLKNYYKTHPDSKLLVAELNGEVVGAITIYKEEGVNGVKLNRLVRRADKPGLGIAHFLIREALARSFADPDKGGFGAVYAIIGVIIPKRKQDPEYEHIEGYEFAREAFKEFYFRTTEERVEDRCVGLSKEKKKLVPRDVEIMALQKTVHVSRWGNDVKNGTSLPDKKAA